MHRPSRSAPRPRRRPRRERSRDGTRWRAHRAAGSFLTRLTDVAFTQIRHYGAGDALVATHLMTLLGEVAARVSAAQQEPLREQAAALLVEARTVLRVACDVSRVEAAGAWSQDHAAAMR